jgi:hypothetical protein
MTHNTPTLSVDQLSAAIQQMLTSANHCCESVNV